MSAMSCHFHGGDHNHPRNNEMGCCWGLNDNVMSKKKLHGCFQKWGGTPKSSILIGFSIINHPFWDTPIFGNTHIGNTNDEEG